MTADDGLDTLQEQLDNIELKQAATSLRQSAEWGMRAVQASFPRLKDTFVQTCRDQSNLQCVFASSTK
jgi:hypothetical protein